MEDDSFKMLKYFPFLVPDISYEQWEGFVDYMGMKISLSISTPNYPSLKNIRIFSNTATHFLRENKLFEENMSGSLSSLLSSLLHPRRTQFQTVWCGTEVESLDRCNAITEELKSIGKHNVLHTDGKLHRISLGKKDEAGYIHRLDLMLPQCYPHTRPVIENIDLPDAIRPQLIHEKSLQGMYRELCRVVSSLQEFWRAYEGLRSSVWLVDPQHPRKRDTYCRFIIDDSVSVVVLLNPLDITSCPEISFLGGDKMVGPLRTRLEINMKAGVWNDSGNVSLTDNLLALLGLNQFPSADDQHTESSSLLEVSNRDECLICFTDTLPDNSRPVKVCNNKKCLSFYHFTCLAQWFQSVPSSEFNFNLISGDCPQCGERILCPVIKMQSA